MIKRLADFEFPFPPSVNSYWQHRTRGTFVSDDGIAFRNDVLAVVLPLRVKPLLCELHAEIELWAPDRRRRDVDNYCKGLLDAMQKAKVFKDDNQIKRMTVEMFKPIHDRPGRSVVRLYEHEPTV